MEWRKYKHFSFNKTLRHIKYLIIKYKIYFKKYFFINRKYGFSIDTVSL